MALDPIEKKPLRHFHPGKSILSVGTWGCNLQCAFCQNWEIAHGAPVARKVSPEVLAALASDHGSKNVGVAYTYSEPIVWYEFVKETALAVRERGQKNVLVTNGFISQEALAELLPLIDAMNIDVKSFRDQYYRNTCGGNLAPVLRTVESAAKACHVEVTTLIVTGLNDGDDEIEEMAEWLSSVNPEIELHLSRYFPCYRMEAPSTPPDTLMRLRTVAQKHLRKVYVGNLPGIK